LTFKDQQNFNLEKS